MKGEKKCFLDRLKNGDRGLFEKGLELELITKAGTHFQCIVYDFRDGYLQTVAQFGVLMLFPLSSLLKVYPI
jgi:hypothetical protein